MGQSEARTELPDQWGARKLFCRSALDRPSYKRVTDDPRAPAAAPVLNSHWSAAMPLSHWSDWRHPGPEAGVWETSQLGELSSELLSQIPDMRSRTKYLVKVFLLCLFPIMTKLTYWHIIENFYQNYSR